MTRTLLTLTSLLVLVSPPAFAQSIASGECRGAQIRGDGEVPIQITAKPIRAAASAKTVVDYAVSLGPNNSMESLCLNGGGTVLLTLTDSTRYEFREITFEYPYGFEPASSPFKLAVVHPDSVVFHMHASPISDGFTFKYTVKVKDLQTGAMLVIDPTITNRPPV
ncbi:MAG: hypothetical protein ACYC42_04375 [Lysobacter sp.]